MSKNRSSFLKRDREARKREKQALKQQRREERKRGDQEEGVPGASATLEQVEEGALADSGDGSSVPPSIENPQPLP